MLIDCINRDFEPENNRITWLLVIILTSWLGAIIYFFAIKISKKKGGIKNGKK